MWPGGGGGADPLTGDKSPDERDEASITKLASGAPNAGAAAARFIQKRVLVTPAKQITPAKTTTVAGKTVLTSAAPAAAKAAATAAAAAQAAATYAAQGKAIGDANRASTQPTYSASGENNNFMPTSYQNSKLQQTGYR